MEQKYTITYFQGEVEWITLQEYALKKSHQRGQSKITHQYKSTGKIESKTTKAVPVWIYQALMHYLHSFPCEDCNEEGKRKTLVMGISKSETKKSV